MIFSKEGARVEFVLGSSSKEKNKAMFDYLFERRVHIENLFGSPLEWRRLDDKKVSIIVFGQEFNGFERENWPAMIEWLVAHVRKSETTFEPEIASLRQLLITRFPRDGIS